MEMGGQRKIGRPQLRWSDVIRNDKLRHEGERGKDRRSTRPKNVEYENSIRRPQIGKRTFEEEDKTNVYAPHNNK